MYFAKALFVCASLVASTISQSTSSRIAFTVLPSTITAGQDVTLHWSGGDGSAVTLTLQKGTSNNLKTVQLVTGDATGTSYTWPVPKSLPNGDNYAFRIQQGDSEPNYTGMITITGGSSSASSATSASASGSKSAAYLSRSSGIATVTANATTTKSVGTAASASGTGASIARNTTMSIATLSATSASSTASNPSVGGSGGSPTGSTSAPSPTKTGGAVSLVASNFALLVCVIVGLVYLG